MDRSKEESICLSEIIRFIIQKNSSFSERHVETAEKYIRKIEQLDDGEHLDTNIKFNRKFDQVCDILLPNLGTFEQIVAVEIIEQIKHEGFKIYEKS